MRQDTREQIFEFLQDYQRQNGFEMCIRDSRHGLRHATSPQGEAPLEGSCRRRRLRGVRGPLPI